MSHNLPLFRKETWLKKRKELLAKEKTVVGSRHCYTISDRKAKKEAKK